MSNNVDEALKGLVEAILESDQYKEYKLQLDAVGTDTPLKAQIDEFRKQNYLMQNGDGMAFESLEAFENQFRTFRLDPLVDKFLAAELDFCRMMQEINFKLVEAVDFQ